jgi:hypothetical protein
METAAKQLLPDRVFDTPDAAVASFKDVLSSWSERWLLVFDNLDNPEDLADILSSSQPVTAALFSLPAVLLVPRNWVSQSNLIAWRRRRASSFCFSLQGRHR